MDQKSDPAELERKLEQARRLAATTSDPTTLHRLREFADELKQKLRRIMRRRAIRARARELWEQNGRPADRDDEFWLAAEREIKEADDLEKLDRI